MDSTIIKLIPRFIWLICTWLLLTLAYIPFFLAGVILVPIAVIRKRYIELEDQYVFQDDWMRTWETRDNGCCPKWYLRAKNFPVWKGIIYWSAFRNAVGGSPFDATNVFDAEVRWWGTGLSPEADGIKHFLETGERKWQWRFIQHGWRVGFWASYPWMREYEKDPTDKFDVIDIQHGFKRNVVKGDISKINLVFSPWDSGRRRN